MPHFLIKKENINENLIRVVDPEVVLHLVSALRIKKGEEIKFIDEFETVYKTKILDFTKKEINAEILTSYKSERKLDFELCALICILKPDAMNLAIQNAVQLGAKEIYTVYSNNSAPKLETVKNKAEKWQKIGLESFKQCERADIPKVYDISTFSEIFSKFKKENILIFAEKYDEMNIQKALLNYKKPEKILAVFGPEGGFSESEFEFFKKENLKLLTLGKLILKAPNAITAGLFGIIENAG